MKKAIGGARLGSGKGMSVNMHAYSRSNHDLSHTIRTSMNAGTLVPVFKQIGLPGDTFDIKTNELIRTVPTNNALFGRFKYRVDFFVTPIRLMVGALHNNMLGVTEDVSKIILPKIELTAAPNTILKPVDEKFDINTQQIAPDSLNRYLGIAGVGFNPTNEDIKENFLGIYHLSYYDICKNYYINTQENLAFYIDSVGFIEEKAQFFKNDNEPIQAGASINVNTGAPETSTSLYLRDYYLEKVDEITFNVSAETTGEKITIKLTSDKNFTTSTIIGTKGTITFTATNNQGGTERRIKITPSKSGNSQTIYLRDTLAEVNVKSANGEALLMSTPIENFDKARRIILKACEVGEYVKITKTGATGQNLINFPPYSSNADFNPVKHELSSKNSQCGLMVRTYLNDLFNNFVKTDWIEDINQASSVQVANGSFTMDALLIAKRVYNYKNRVALSGGTMQDWQEVTWGVDAQSFVESPIFVGGTSGEIIFDEVVSTAATENEALGTLAGRGNINYGDRKGGIINIKIKEPSVIMGICSIIPYIDYFQGNSWEMSQLKTLEDLHKPEFDGIGFQDLPTEQLAWWDRILDSSTETKTFTLGKQPAWVQYMTEVNRVYGDFARKSNTEGMVITREYKPNGKFVRGQSNIKDATTYVDPRDYNYLFAGSSLEDQPFWVQIHFNVLARRKMSAAIMPNL